MRLNSKKDTMTFKQCCSTIAQVHKLGNNLVTGHRYSYFEEAALLYGKLCAEEALKRAAKNAEMKGDDGACFDGISIDKDSILNTKLDFIK